MGGGGDSAKFKMGKHWGKRNQWDGGRANEIGKEVGTVLYCTVLQVQRVRATELVKKTLLVTKLHITSQSISNCNHFL